MLVRIAKAIAARSNYSRRQAELLIAEGRVSVNSQIIEHPSVQIDPSDPSLAINNMPLAAIQNPTIWLLHKPTGTITTTYDPQGRPTVFSLLPEALQGLKVIGRLDIESEGLLLFTNSGAIKRHFELPSSQITRVYHVRIYGTPDPQILHELAEGLDFGHASYQPVEIAIISGQGRNSWLQFSLKEGKKSKRRIWR